MSEHAIPGVPGRLPSEPEAIFVVGLSRSGTTLMRTILERSPRIAIAAESHFVGHLVEREGARFYFHRLGDPAADETLRAIVEFIYSGEFQRRSRVREISPFWRWLIAEVPRQEVERRLLALAPAERNDRGLMATFIRLYADVRGKPIPGEKTPAHLAYVDTLLEWFPDARVVHMMRDPRAVYVSDRQRRLKRPRRPPFGWIMRVPLMLSLVLLVQVALVWRGAARRDAVLSTRYPERYRLVRFEDVVREPDESLSALFEFLGVEPPADPTAVKVVSHGFRWGEEGLDAGAAERWREHINPVVRRLLNLFLGRSMRRFGYAP